MASEEKSGSGWDAEESLEGFGSVTAWIKSHG